MAKAQTIENEFVKVPDFTQFQAEFSKWAGDFGKYFVNGKAPSFDFDAVFALQRKNVEAFTAANQLAFDGVKAVAQRQAEIARKAFEEFGKVTKELTAAPRKTSSPSRPTSRSRRSKTRLPTCAKWSIPCRSRRARPPTC
jgi:hypothetical protein